MSDDTSDSPETQPEELEREALATPGEPSTELQPAGNRTQIPYALGGYRPGTAPLGNVLRMEDVATTYGSTTKDFVHRRLGHGFVVRLAGGRVGTGQVDAIVLGSLLESLGRAVAWINNSVAQKRTVPGVELAAAISSVVVQFAAAPEEMEFNEHGFAVAPTAIAGSVIPHLLLSDEPAILEGAAFLRSRATGTLLTALERFAEDEVAVDWLMLDRGAPHEVHTSEKLVRDTIAVLAQPVAEIHRTIRVTGILYAADQYGHTFKMDVTRGELAGKTISGRFDRGAASESLDGAWRRSVDAELRVIEAARPGLPRSPRTRYELVKVIQVRHDRVPIEPQSVLFELDPDDI